jgi:hypothetical protein
MTDISRSFSYKLNVGNYESRDFFCAQKVECRIEDAEDISDRLYQFCRSQVMRAVNDYMAVVEISNRPRLEPTRQCAATWWTSGYWK